MNYNTKYVVRLSQKEADFTSPERLLVPRCGKADTSRLRHGSFSRKS